MNSDDRPMRPIRPTRGQLKKHQGTGTGFLSFLGGGALRASFLGETLGGGPPLRGPSFFIGGSRTGFVMQPGQSMKTSNYRRTRNATALLAIQRTREQREKDQSTRTRKEKKKSSDSNLLFNVYGNHKAKGVLRSSSKSEDGSDKMKKITLEDSISGKIKTIEVHDVVKEVHDAVHSQDSQLKDNAHLLASLQSSFEVQQQLLGTVMNKLESMTSYIVKQEQTMARLYDRIDQLSPAHSPWQSHSIEKVGNQHHTSHHNHHHKEGDSRLYNKVTQVQTHVKHDHPDRRVHPDGRVHLHTKRKSYEDIPTLPGLIEEEHNEEVASSTSSHTHHKKDVELKDFDDDDG